jgi:hypothetical protein
MLPSRACVRACVRACACVRAFLRAFASTRARGVRACVPACRSDGGTTDSTRRGRRWRAQLAPHAAERLSACLRLGGAPAAGAAGGGAGASAGPVAAGSYLGALAAVMLWLVLGSPGGLPAGCTRDYHGSGLTPLQSHSVRNLAKFWHAAATTFAACASWMYLLRLLRASTAAMVTMRLAQLWRRCGQGRAQS